MNVWPIGGTLGAIVALALAVGCSDHAGPTDADPPPPVGSVIVANARVANRDALVALYNATGGPYWKNNRNWGTSAPLGDWYGVTVDAEGNVVGLNLSNNHLAGSIPPAIGRLTSLILLNLSGNKLRGPIPPETGSLVDLEWLTLGNNRLADSIPGEIGNLRNLLGLSLGPNRLTGSIPPEIGALDSLGFLDFTGTELSGAIPSEVGGMTNLRYFFLSGTRVAGTIPSEIAKLQYLESLVLSRNELSGDLPPEIWNLNYLDTLDLSHNRLSGEIPSGIGDLDYLAWMDLSGNEFAGALPPEIWNASYMEHMDLSDNRLTGSIPDEIDNLAHVESMDFSNNGLSGPLPLGRLMRMESLFVADFRANSDLCLRQAEYEEYSLALLSDFLDVPRILTDIEILFGGYCATTSASETWAKVPFTTPDRARTGLEVAPVAIAGPDGWIESLDLASALRRYVSQFGDAAFGRKLRVPPDVDQ